MNSNQSIIKGTHKDMRPPLKEIVRLGGNLRITGGNHIQVELGGYKRIVGKTPKDPNNNIHDIKKVIKQFNNGILPQPTRKG